MLLCGADLLASLTIPGVWENPEALLQQHGIACIVREGTDLDALLQHELLNRYMTVLVLFYVCCMPKPGGLSVRTCVGVGCVFQFPASCRFLA